MQKIFSLLFLCLATFTSPSYADVQIGIEELYSSPQNLKMLYGKKIGLITNHTAVNKNLISTIELIKTHASENHYELVALFAPEHGISGAFHADETVEDDLHAKKIPIYSLHGKTRRPNDEMLKGIDLLIFDIQDIGSRSYTYITTLFYVMEEAAKRNIPVLVTDRPNPINGVTVDGPMLDEKFRSFVGYVNVPYCHGMTVGELAHFYNSEYEIGCKLNVIPMKGWKRTMTFDQTKLPWIPTSPHIPEPSTAYYYPMTGILGELHMVNIGVGYTLPFKVVGAPWINGNTFAHHLNKQKLPGVRFHAFDYKPFYGTLAKEECSGVLIHIQDHLTYQPVTTQFVILGLLKSLYPKEFAAALKKSAHRAPMFHQVLGTDQIYRLLKEKSYVAWELRSFDEEKRKEFLKKRKRYLIKSYG